MSDTPISSPESGAIFLAVSTSIATFTALLPHLSDVRKADRNDPSMRADVRMGELSAATLVVAVGIMASGVAASPTPAMASIIAALVLIAVYESVLSANPTK